MPMRIDSDERREAIRRQLTRWQESTLFWSEQMEAAQGRGFYEWPGDDYSKDNGGDWMVPVLNFARYAVALSEALLADDMETANVLFAKQYPQYATTAET